MIGRTLSHYAIVEKIGQGGMGEVYRARDTTLGRDVAIKIIPPRLLGDDEHRARFEREARLLASLSHPHIAAIHGLEVDGDHRFIVLELITGADLARRLETGPMPVDEVLRVARQIADALEFAHRQGVVHRDLKPGNVAFTSEGSAKVLDFGLAKALESGPDTIGDLSQSPTRLAGTTAPNVILGTAAYMSPEQARGSPVDQRSDVWAFGCVVYECLTARRLFAGESVSDTLAAVLRDPIDWSALPADTPLALRRLIRRCLERDPRRRLHSLADARLELDDAAEEHERGPGLGEDPRIDAAGRPARPRLGWILWALVAMMTVVVIAQMRSDRTHRTPPRVTRFAIPVEGLDVAMKPPTVSPDGRRVVYSASGHLWVRALDALEAQPLEGTDGARFPFWSPDNSAIGFELDRRLWRVSVEGGRAIAICSTPEDFDDVARAVWGPGDHIVFASGNGGVYEVHVTGGDPVCILEPDARRESDFHAPSLLPGGRGVLVVPHPLSGARSKLDLIRDGEHRELWEHPGDITIEYPIYQAGHILYHRVEPEPAIWAVPFSLDDLSVEGEPFLVAAGGQVPSVSDDGTLVYAGAGSEGHDLIRVDRQGRVQGEPIDRALHIDDVALSPSGTKLIEAFLQGSHYSLEVRDLMRGTRTVVASGPEARNPFWLSDTSVGVVRSDSSWIEVHDLELASGPRVLFRAGELGVFQRTSACPSVTSDGRRLLVQLHAPTTKSNVWMIPLDASEPARPLRATNAQEIDPQACPTASLFAYVSDESGRSEVYLSQLEAESTPLRRWQVSSDGGMYPRWSPDGTRLIYESDGRLMEVDIEIGDGVSLGRPQVLFDLGERQLELVHGYTPDPDGSTFLMIQAGDPAETSGSIVVVQNWVEAFRGH